jgi:nucleoside 2-deoxyribosyltransferase
MQSMTRPRIRLIGEVCIDVFLHRLPEYRRIRLGGIIHAARTLWALGIDYDLFYLSPQYLKNHIHLQAATYGAQEIKAIGVVEGSPNVMLVSYPKEVGPQGYEMLLNDSHECIYDQKVLSSIQNNDSVSDIVVFNTGFGLTEILSAIAKSKAAIHIDIGHNLGDINTLSNLGRLFQTIMVSTSSHNFLYQYGGSVFALRDSMLSHYCEYLLFKENRGGSRFFSSKEPAATILVGSQTRAISHSVGVGDCFDVAYIALRHKYPHTAALTYASWIAAEYASTVNLSHFKKACDRVMSISPEDIIKIEGVSLPWENRQSFNIYIAGPDFDYIDTSPIEFIAECLRYHNFVPRLPVREYGQVDPDDPKQIRNQIFSADMKLMTECKMLIAVLLNNDAGTLIEIGLAVGIGMPVIVYDPYRISNNLMLNQLPCLITSNPDDVIVKLFETLSKVKI